jgi:glycosyltransferase involved in cell wall biosynthesis
MPDLISICIPTCDRVHLLRLALQSCIEQTHRPIEILIGDDSAQSTTEDWIASVAVPDGISLHYERNQPRLGQAGNVNRLFARARGKCLLILHDDDLLAPGGLDALAAAWTAHPGVLCVYGAQTLIDEAGYPMPAETDVWNRRYYRTPDQAHAQQSALVAAFWQQVPNDCYLIDTALARRIGYRPEAEIGQCVDAEFVIRAAQECPAYSFVYIDRPVSEYRLTASSIARAQDLNRRQDLFYDVVDAIAGDEATRDAQHILLARISIGASLDAAMARRRDRALSIIFSRHYAEPYWSKTTLYRLVCAFFPTVGAWTKALIRRTGAPPTLRESTLS